MSEGQQAPRPRGARKVRTVTVVCERIDMWGFVAIARGVTHGLYGKGATRTSRVVAHDERNEAHVGDVVRIAETRPLSKTKRWRVLAVGERAR